MYLRHSTRRKNGKKYAYWRLVRSVRTGAKVRQETVAYLGEIDAEGRASAKALAREIAGGEECNAQRDLFGERTLSRFRYGWIASGSSAAVRSATYGWGASCGER